MKLGPQGGITKEKFLGKCFSYGNKVHKSNECKLSQKKNESIQANMIDYIV